MADIQSGCKPQQFNHHRRPHHHDFIQPTLVENENCVNFGYPQSGISAFIRNIKLMQFCALNLKYEKI